MLGNISDWVLGAVTAILGIGGLFAAAQAGHGVGYFGGLAMFIFCVLFIFTLIKSSFDTQE